MNKQFWEDINPTKNNKKKLIKQIKIGKANKRLIKVGITNSFGRT
jgi:hypothetical protein